MNGGNLHDCLVNGEIARQISIDDRGYLYAHGLFETLAVHRGQAMFWLEHHDRLQTGCRKLGLQQADPDLLLREIQTVCTGLNRALVRIVISARGGPRGYQAVPDSPTNRVVSAFAFPENVIAPRKSGVELTVCEQKLSLNRPLAGIKHLGKLEQVMAAAELRGSKYADGLMLDAEGYVICTTSANLFLVDGEQMFTPRLDRCGVHGTIRTKLLRSFPQRVEKRRITLEMLNDVSEMFICNSIRGIWPVTVCANKKLHVGQETRRLQQWLADTSALMEVPR